MPSKPITLVLDEMNDGQPKYRAVLVCDTQADVTALGTTYSAGSIAVVPGDAKYMLSPSGTWGEF